jgi:glycosyltransferase involved in cell wall biosynthesis
LSSALRGKTSVLMEIALSREQIGAPRGRRASHRRLLYAGRLLYWKGLHIAIEAMAILVQRMPEAHLTVVGNGPEKRRFQADVAHRNLGANIEFVSRMPQDEFFRLYDSHDLLLFPSLHDSEGWVVLEALGHGMPVACLDLGGPKEIVTPRSGVVVGTAGLTTGEVAARLADELCDLLKSPERMERLSAGAIERSQDFMISDRVARLYDEARRVIDAGSGATSPHPVGPIAGPANPPVRADKAPAVPEHLLT